MCSLPLLVDVDTGFGGAFNIARTVKSLIRDGAAGLHMEDQVAQKRCGHRPGKAVVSQSEMVDRIKAAVDARTNDDFVIMARTDSLAVEGMEPAVDLLTDRFAHQLSEVALTVMLVRSRSQVDGDAVIWQAGSAQLVDQLWEIVAHARDSRAAGNQDRSRAAAAR